MGILLQPVEPDEKKLLDVFVRTGFALNDGNPLKYSLLTQD